MIAVSSLTYTFPQLTLQLILPRIYVLLTGAIKGATSRQTLGLLDTWLRLIKDVYRLHKDHLDMIEVHAFSLLYTYIPLDVHLIYN